MGWLTPLTTRTRRRTHTSIGKPQTRQNSVSHARRMINGHTTKEGC